MAPTMSDQVKAHTVRLMRRSHWRTLHTTSDRTFRRRQVATSPAPRLMPAARRYRGMGWLPTSLLAPEKLPAEAKLPKRYFLPYYATSKVAWLLYAKMPIDNELEWEPKSGWNGFFSEPPPGWGTPTDDDTFVALRLQGPNPFMLRSAEPLTGEPARAEGAKATVFSLDFGNRFRGFEGAQARFAVAGDSLRPLSIRIGQDVYTPDQGERWEDAKRIINGLDGREAAFVRHLLNAHLMVGQAYALAAYSLPVWHPLRGFMDFFTYGTLAVNDAAYQSLLAPISYFLVSNFISDEDARVMIEDATTAFDFDQWIWPLDKKARELDHIPNHPYVVEADALWPIFHNFVVELLDELSVDDHEVVVDPHIARWYDTLCEVLPGDESLPKITGRAALEDLMTALLWNNVIHEVCGNLSPLLDSRDPRDLVGINFEHLRAMKPGESAPAPLAGDVFLMDQAVFASSFNVAGNCLTTLSAAAYVDDPRLRDAIERLQVALVDAERAMDARNVERPIPFQNMEPSRFEASISF